MVALDFPNLLKPWIWQSLEFEYNQTASTTSSWNAPYRITSYVTCCHCSSAQRKNMSNKIDEFLTTVQRCEVELQEEYETRQRRMAAARARRMTSGSGCMSRPRPQGARSASTASVNSANRTLDFSKQPPGNRRQSAQVNKVTR